MRRAARPSRVKSCWPGQGASRLAKRASVCRLRVLLGPHTARCVPLRRLSIKLSARIPSPILRRMEDRGLILFVSSMTAVKQTAEACRQGQKLLESLLIKADVRDVFKSSEYSSQLRRLSGAALKGGKREAPPLPQLYLNGKLIGGLDEMKAQDQDGTLVKRLMAYRWAIAHARGWGKLARS